MTAVILVAAWRSLHVSLPLSTLGRDGQFVFGLGKFAFRGSTIDEGLHIMGGGRNPIDLQAGIAPVG
jgi:hypothetical protein